MGRRTGADHGAGRQRADPPGPGDDDRHPLGEDPADPGLGSGPGQRQVSHPTPTATNMSFRFPLQRPVSPVVSVLCLF